MAHQPFTISDDLRKLLKRGSLFLVTATAMYYLLLVIFVSIRIGNTPLIYRVTTGMVWKGGYTYERFNKFEKEKKYNVIVLGSSRANRGLNPRIFESQGLTCYNLGTDDQTPLNTYVLAKSYIKKGKCDLVVIDLFDKVFSQSHLESTADIIQNVDDNKVAMEMSMKAKDIRTFNLFNVRMILRNSLPDYSSKDSLYNGFRAIRGDKGEFRITKVKYKRNPEYLKSLDNTLAHLKSNGIPCLLIAQPMPMLKSGADHQKFLKDIEPILEKYDQVVHDFTDADNIVTAEHFSDPEHLNETGSETYTNFLLENLILNR